MVDNTRSVHAGVKRENRGENALSERPTDKAQDASRFDTLDMSWQQTNMMILLS